MTPTVLESALPRSRWGYYVAAIEPSRFQTGDPDAFNDALYILLASGAVSDCFAEASNALYSSPPGRTAYLYHVGKIPDGWGEETAMSGRVLRLARTRGASEKARRRGQEV